MKKSIFIVMAMAVGATAARGQADPFENLKAAMAAAACCRFEFLSIIESDVFDSIDTTSGTALIAADGRYYVQVGPDEYLRTADLLYSYSGTENQLTVERVPPGDPSLASVSFLTRLDDYYHTRVVSPARTYFLTLADTSSLSLPDSLTVSLVPGRAALDRIEYFDVNDDRNRLVFRDSRYLDVCEEAALTPRFPDSAEVINLR